MDVQKEREAFKAWFKKEYLGIDNLANQGDEGAITRRDYAYLGWQAAKAQAVPEGFVLVPKHYIENAIYWGDAKDSMDMGSELVLQDMKAMSEAQEQNHD